METFRSIVSPFPEVARVFIASPVALRPEAAGL